MGALGASLVALALALVASVLSAADSGTSFGPQVLVAERVWFAAAAVGMAAVVLGLSSVVSRRGRRLGVVALAVVILAGPVAIVVMDSLPAA
jgi:hypothetical protein